MALPNVLNRFRLRTLDDVHQHCEQDDALIATWYYDRHPMILHHCNCPSFRGDRIDLRDWPKCGTSIHTFEEFQNAVLTTGTHIVTSCPRPECAALAQLVPLVAE
jgi:hypothetical protein